jgi:putative ABC transport system permease protein
VKLTSAGAFNQFNDALNTNPQLKVKVVRQEEFLADQSSMLTKFIETIGFFIAAMMALGAIFGALNTMYSAISARTREIATLRALGFGAGPVVISVMLESLAIAIVGGAFGALVAYFAFNGFKTSTINWQTFSQIAFAFRVTPPLLVGGVMWAVLIGLIGGLFPAVRAARLPIAAALREL